MNLDVLVYMESKITGGLIYKKGKIIEKDIGIENGKIKKIDNNIGKAKKEIDGSKCLILPGLVNSHTHAAMSLMRGYSDALPLNKWLNEIWKIEDKLQPEDVKIGTKLACLEMIKTGTTAFADMYFHMNKVADVVEKSGLRACLGYGMIGENKKGKEELDNAIEFALRNEKTKKIKKMITPHSAYTCDGYVLKNSAKKARELNLSLHIHLNETKEEIEDIKEKRGENPTEYLNSLDFWKGKSFVAHGTHFERSELDILDKKNIGVVHCPSANMKLGSGSAPIKKMINKNIEIAIGTDGPASNNTLDMFEEMKQAALLLNSRGIQISPKKILEMATKNGSNFLGFNSGKIEEGKNADLIFLDLTSTNLHPQHNLLSNIIYSTKGENIKSTMIGGKIIMEDGKIKTLNKQKIINKAEEKAKKLASKASQT